MITTPRLRRYPISVVIDALFAASCLASSRRAFWTSPRGMLVNASRIFVMGELIGLAREIDSL